MKSIHHVGYVVRNIIEFKKSFPPLRLIKVVEDPIQRARIELLGFDTGCAVELISPQDEQSFTWNFLQQRGEGLHHVCYEGYSLSEVEDLIRDQRMVRLRGPIPAILFNRDVIFAMTRTRNIVEFLI